MFSDLGLTQLVNEPTHKDGNILDYVLSSKPANISNVVVDSNNLVCDSDHHLITFNIMSKVKRTKLPKREISNFKRADWDSLNNDFNEVDWNSILLRDSNTERAYGDFISTFSDKCNRRIPKIKIKQSNQTPWYDSETYESCRLSKFPLCS